MAQSAILDRSGTPYEKRMQTAPNLDPNFWLTETRDTHKDILTKPYAHHVWTNVCVRSISQNVSTLQRQLQMKKDGTILKEHPILKLFDKPNQLMQRVSFFRMILSHLLLPAIKGGSTSGGQCFVIPWNGQRDDKVRLDKGEIPTELFPYQDSYFEPWLETRNGGRVEFKGWKFSVPQAPGSEIYFAPGEIIRVAMLNPYDILKGMSPFSPVANAVAFDAHADSYNSENFKNSGRLDGQVSSEQYVDPTELQKLKTEWYKQYTGEGRHRVAFLAGGLKYEQFAASAADMQYIEQEKWSRQKVLGAYGLNRIGAGDYEDINFATIREGRKMLWYDTYIPIDEIILDAFNGQWINFIDQGKYSLTSNYTIVPALQADMQERAKTGGILVTQMGYPPSLASRIVQLPLSQDDIDKWPHLDEQIQTASPASAFPEESAKMIGKTVKRDYSGEYIERVLDPGERYFKRTLDRFFIDQRNGIMDQIDRWTKKNTKAIKESPTVSAWEFITEELRQNLELMKIYKPAVKNQITLEKQQVESELGRGIQWDAGDTRVQYWANKRSVYLEDINTNTFTKAGDAIDATIKQGIADGLTVPELGREIKKAVHEVYEVRLGRPVEPNGLFDLGGMSSSQTIARTEMGIIASMSRNDIFKSEGVEKIEWITSQDDRVRDSHAAIDGSTIRIGEEFPSVGLRYPRDPEGEPGEIINCRCAFVAVIE